MFRLEPLRGLDHGFEQYLLPTSSNWLFVQAAPLGPVSPGIDTARPPTVVLPHTHTRSRAVSTCQANPTRPATEEPFRSSRRASAGLLHQARQAGIPHTTLHYWRQRQQRTEAPAALVAFFDSPEGLAFLQQLLLA